MLTRRKFIIGMTAGATAALLPSQSQAFWPLLFGRIAVGAVRIAGYASRGSSVARTGMRASRYYRKTNNSRYSNLQSVSSYDRRRRLTDTEKRLMRSGIREGAKEYISYLSNQDKYAVIRNTDNLINSANSFEDVSRLVEFCSKYENRDGVVFFAAREELDGNYALRSQVNSVVRNTDLVYASLNRDHKYEKKLKRGSRAFLTL